MNEKIESALDSAKEMWDRNKGKIAVITTATTIGMVLIMRANRRTVDAFLEQEGLMEDFWKFIGADEDDIESFTKH
jgi:hypothetical protein